MSDSDDDSDDIFSAVFNKNLDSDSDDDLDGQDNAVETGERGGQGGGDGALTSTSGSNDIDRGDDKAPRRDHKYSTADMKQTPCWWRCLQILLMLLILVAIMFFFSWLMQKIFYSAELKPDDYEESGGGGGGGAVLDDGSGSGGSMGSMHNSIMPKGRQYVEDVCSANKISGGERVFCEKTCEPYNDCCADMFNRQNGTCFEKEVTGCYGYSKCSALKGVVDPAPTNLDRICDPITINVNPDECLSMCKNVRCCWDDSMPSCVNKNFESCLDYSYCQNLRAITTKKQIVPVGDTNLDTECKRESKLCKRECYNARCCDDESSDCFRTNFISCLSYSSCNYMDAASVDIKVAPLFSKMKPAPGDITTVCTPEMIEMNPRTCEASCDSAKCCFASGKDNCFGDDPLGCLEYSPCGNLYNDTSAVVNPAALSNKKKTKEEPKRFEHNREFIINMCGQVELNDVGDYNACYDYCYASLGCCDPYESDASFDCYADEIGGCYSYSRCHTVTNEGLTDYYPPSPDTLDDICSMEALEGQGYDRCLSECRAVECCWDYMNGTVAPCLDESYIVCQDYLPCQNLKAKYLLDSARVITPPKFVNTVNQAPDVVTKSSSASSGKRPPPPQLNATNAPPRNATSGVPGGNQNRTSGGQGGGTPGGPGGGGQGGGGQGGGGGGGGTPGGPGGSGQGGGGPGGGGQGGRNLRHLQAAKMEKTVVATPMVVPVAPNDLDDECEDGTDECTSICAQAAPCCSNPFSKCYRDNFMSCLSYGVCPSQSTASKVGEIHSIVQRPSKEERLDIEQKCSYQVILTYDSTAECEAACEDAKCCFEDFIPDEYCFPEDPLGCLHYYACQILYNLYNIPKLAHLQPPPRNITVKNTAAPEPKIPPGNQTAGLGNHAPSLLGGGGASKRGNATEPLSNLTEIMEPKEPKAFPQHRDQINGLCTKEYIGNAITEQGGSDAGPCLTACQEAQFEDCCDPFKKASSSCYSEAGCYAYSRCHAIIDRDYDPPTKNDLSRICHPTALQVDPTECLNVCESLRCCWDNSVGLCLANKFNVCLDYSACQNLRHVVVPKALEGKSQEAILRSEKSIPVASSNLDLECKKNSTECKQECALAEACCSDLSQDCFRDNFVACLSYSACKQSNVNAIDIPLPVIHDNLKHAKRSKIEDACTPGGASYSKEECDTICKPANCCWKNPSTSSCFHNDPFGCLEYALCSTGMMVSAQIR